MGSAVIGVLSVHKTEAGLAVVVAVGDGKFERLGTKRDHVVEPFSAGFRFQQVLQPPARQVELAIQIERQPAVQIGVHPHPLFKVLLLEGVAGEQSLIRREKTRVPLRSAHSP